MRKHLVRLPIKYVWFVFLVLVILIAKANSPLGASKEPIALTLSSTPSESSQIMGRGWIQSISWSPDGEELAVGSSTGIWLYTNTLEDVTHLTEAESLAVGWSPNGSWIASGTSNFSVQIWNVSERRLKVNFEGHQAPIKSLAWSPDSRFLVSVGDIAVRVWDVINEQETQVLQGHTSGVNDVAWSTDGKFIATISSDETIRIWNTDTWTSVQILQSNATQVTWTHSNSNDNLLMIADYDETTKEPILKIWNQTSDQYILTMNDFNSIITSIDESYPLGFLAVSGADGDVQVRETATGNLVTRFQGDLGYINTVSWQPSRNYLATSDGVILKIWDISTKQAVYTLIQHSGSMMDISWSPDNLHIASVGDRTLKIWDIDTGLVEQVFPVSSFNQSVSWNPINNFIAGSSDEKILIWDIGNDELYEQLEGHTDVVTTVEWSPNGRYLSSGGWDKTIRIWDMETGKLAQTLDGHTDFISALDWNPDSTRLASSGSDSTVKIWSVQTKELLITLSNRNFGNMTSIEWSPSGNLLAIADYNVVTIWDSETGNLAATPNRIEGSINAIAWGPDNTHLAGAGYGLIWIWNINTGEVAATFEGHIGEINAIQWNSDGTLLASAGQDGTIRVWSVQDIPSES